MKILIWIGIIFVTGVINVLFQLGAIPMLLLYVAAIFLGRAMCGALDESRQKAAAEKEAAGQAVPTEAGEAEQEKSNI